MLHCKYIILRAEKDRLKTSFRKHATFLSSKLNFLLRMAFLSLTPYHFVTEEFPFFLKSHIIDVADRMGADEDGIGRDQIVGDGRKEYREKQVELGEAFGYTMET